MGSNDVSLGIEPDIRLAWFSAKSTAFATIESIPPDSAILTFLAAPPEIVGLPFRFNGIHHLSCFFM